jgi:transcriptional regulator with XRE-family HTH domain
MVHTRGRALLLEYLDREGAITQAALAARLGVTEPSLSAWKHGATRPEPHFRKALERVAGIPESAWMTNRERLIASGDAA